MFLYLNNLENLIILETLYTLLLYVLGKGISFVICNLKHQMSGSGPSLTFAIFIIYFLQVNFWVTFKGIRYLPRFGELHSYRWSLWRNTSSAKSLSVNTSTSTVGFPLESSIFWTHIFGILCSLDSCGDRYMTSFYPLQFPIYL
jgi:hypothetical protein